LLALDGRFESFSLSRDISYQKVFLIDKLARDHGVKLAAIMGHDTEINDDEIQLARAFAKQALKKKSLPENKKYQENQL
jgi:hypothetical protein